jgi:long-subunit acyl-CoA synthetase (AMP-forming)
MSGLLGILERSSSAQSLLLRDEKTSWRGTALFWRVHELAALLTRRGIRRLALHADNSAAWIIADLACQEADIVCVPLPVFFTRPQQMHALQACGIDALLTPAPALFDGDFATREELNDLGLTLLRKDPLKVPPLPEGTGKVTFTSGSTGTPKGVCLGTAQQLLQASALTLAVQVKAPRHLCALPLSTLLENIAGVYAPLLAGGTVVTRGMAELGFAGSRLAEPQQFLQVLSTVRPDTLILIPQLLQLLVHAVKQGWQAPPFKFIAVGGSRVSAALIREAHALGLPVYEGYGLSECASVVSLNTAAAEQPGSCGKALAHLQVTLDEGEIHVNGNTMLGYVDEPETWYRKRIATGDLGYLDAEGFLHINGRGKNVLINSYGRNISPEWVESELLASPLVAEAVVFGDARPHCVALLTPRQSTVPDEALESALASVNARLPDYAQVKQWLRLPQPLAAGKDLSTANGRPRRERIAALYGAEIDALYEREPAAPIHNFDQFKEVAL